MHTTIFLDIDGVLNALSNGFPRQNTQWFGDWNKKSITIDNQRYWINWSSELIEELNKLTTREDIEIKWLTTWQMDAVTQFGPTVGLPTLDTILIDNPDDMYSGSGEWWKLTLMQKIVPTINSDQFIWIDDDLKHDPKSLKWLKEQEDYDILAVTPESTHGLTKKDIDVIIDFIDKKI